MTFKNLCDQVSCRTESEWSNLLCRYRDNTRAWVQAHGELAACLGFVAGILIVFFLRVFAWLLFISAVAAGIIWLRAPESRGCDCSGPDLK